MILKLVIPLLETQDHHARSLEIEAVKHLFGTRYARPIAVHRDGEATYHVTVFVDGSVDFEQPVWDFLQAHGVQQGTLVPPCPCREPITGSLPVLDTVQETEKEHTL